MKRIPSIIVLFLLTVSACAAPVTVLPDPTHAPTLTFIPTATPTTAVDATPTLTAVPSVTVTSLPAGPTKTPAPTGTAIPFPSGTSTPSVPMAWSPEKDEVPCMKGPDQAFAVHKSFKAAEIVGQDETGLWWYIKVDESKGRYSFCWVSKKKVFASGNFSIVPVTEPEDASVMAVNISLDGGYTQTVACGKKTDKPEFRFTGEIVTNGPVKKLRYQWETSAGVKFPLEQTQVLAWDAPARFKITISVPAQEGTYSLTLRTIYPNEIVWVVQFVVKCK
jgi:hypothetical protein